MNYTTIGAINEYASESINPALYPDTVFEVYSVPVFETGHPEFLRGDEIGSTKQVVQKDDVLICKINPRINRVWVVADETDKQNIASSEWIVIRTKEYNPEFLGWYFRSSKFKALMVSEVAGIGGSLTRAQPKRVAGYPVPLLNRSQQDEIVQRLNSIKRIIEARQRQLHAFDTLIKARFVEMFGDEKHHLSLQEVCSIITDGTHQPPKFVPAGIPFIFVSNIVGNTITYEAEKYIDQATYDELIRRTPIEIGDILLSTVGSYGHPAVVKSDRKFLFQRHIAYLKPKHNIVNSDYLHGAILSSDAQQQIEEAVKGIAQKTLNLSEIRKITIPVPPLEAQSEFASFVSHVDKSKAIAQAGLDKAQLLFDSLMQKYFG